MLKSFQACFLLQAPSEFPQAIHAGRERSQVLKPVDDDAEVAEDVVEGPERPEAKGWDVHKESIRSRSNENFQSNVCLALIFTKQVACFPSDTNTTC